MLSSPPEKIFLQSLVFRLGAGLFFLVPMLLCVAATLATGRWDGVFVAAPLAALFAGYWTVVGKERIALHADGISRKTVFGQTALRWDEVDGYFYRAAPGAAANAAAHVGKIGGTLLKLHTSTGRKLAITTVWQDVYELVKLTLERVEKSGCRELLQQLHSGDPVDFGPFDLTNQGLSSLGRPPVALSALRRVELTGNRVRVLLHGKSLSAFSVDSFEIPCVFALLDALRSRGVDAPDARPH
jgi:hypothetical protein